MHFWGVSDAAKTGRGEGGPRAGESGLLRPMHICSGRPRLHQAPGQDRDRDLMTVLYLHDGDAFLPRPELGSVTQRDDPR